MKFAETLGAHITPEWRKQYIQYEEMKAMLYTAVEEAPSPEIVELDVRQRYFANFDERFFTFCDKELTKIDTFYSEKLAEATRKYAALSSELEMLKEPHASEGRSFGFGRRRISGRERPIVAGRKMKDLKLAFSEYYLSLVILQTYQNLNFTGFRKILKKHDKMLNNDGGAKWRSEYVETAHFYTNKSIDKLIQDTESCFTQDLEGGDRQKAMKRLRVPPLGEPPSPWITFKVGLFCGAFIVLIVTVLISSLCHEFPTPGSRGDWRVAFRLFRGPFLVILLIFFIGVNVYFWRSNGVNHVLIFELDPRSHLSEQDLLELAGVLGVLWALSVLAFLYSEYIMVPAYWLPLFLVGIMFVFLVNPTKRLYGEARLWLLKYIMRISCAPFFYVGFADFWLADQFTSLATGFTDFYFMICFYATPGSTVNDNWMVATNYSGCSNDLLIPVVQCFPAWCRFMQCLRRYRDTREAFPHLVNAGKYSTTFFVVLFSKLDGVYHGGAPNVYGVFFWLWIASLIVNSVYTYAWDIKMDWGLMDGGENPVLREETVYPSTIFYYIAILEDLSLRFVWVATISLTESAGVSADVLSFITAPLEVFRRFMWNFLRLENEHLNNCGKFRVVRDISIAPIEASDQAQIIKMMDEEDGVLQVRKRKTTAATGRKLLSQSPVIDQLKAITE